MLRAIVIICGVLLGILLATIVVAVGHGEPLAALGRVLADPWGLVTTVESGIGVLFVCAWMSVVEPRPACAVAWVIALLVLGHVATLVFLIWRSRWASSAADLFLPGRGDRGAHV